MPTFMMFFILSTLSEDWEYSSLLDDLIFLTFFIYKTLSHLLVLTVIYREDLEIITSGTWTQ